MAVPTEIALPTSQLGMATVSRLVIGGNMFSGFSHQTAEMDKAMRDYYTSSRIKQTLAECEAVGINTFFGRADNHVLRLMNEYWNEGGKIQYFAQTASERADAAANIKQVAHYGATGCYLHGGHADDLFEGGKMDEMADLVQLIRDEGMVAGIAGHNPETHKAADQAGLPLDFHMLCFYNIDGRRGNQLAADDFEKFDDRDRDRAIEARKLLKAPCVGYKVLAAGRKDPEEGFRFAFENLKPGDCINVGMYTEPKPNMAAENAQLVTKIITDLGQA